MEKLIYILTILTITVSTAYGQNDRSLIRDGNKAFRGGKYPQAEVKYRKALDVNSHNPQAIYNLGCAIMKQGRDSVAMEQFEKASKLETNKLRRAKSFHNMGVILQKQKNYKNAIEAYKNALRNNPNNNDTRYNLILCQKQLQQQSQQNQNNQQRNKNNKDNKQNQNNKNNKKQNKNNDKQSSGEQMDRQNAEQLMDAAMREEQATHERLKKMMQQPSSRKTNKNW